MIDELLSTIRAHIAALDTELTTAAHSVGDMLTMLRAARAAEGHLSAALQAIYDHHDQALGIGPAPASIAPAETRRAA